MIIALAVVVGVGGGVFYYLRSHRNAVQPVSQSMPPMVASSTTSATSSSTPQKATPSTRPQSSTSKTVPAASGIRGIAKLGPTCPVQPAYDPTGACADKPFAGQFEVKSSIGTVVKTFSTGSTGTFSVALPAGTYSIEPLPGTYYPRMISQTGIVVKSGQFTEITILFDSGIR